MLTEELPRLQARVRPATGPGDDSLLAMAELLIAGAFVIKDIEIRKAGGLDWRAIVVFPTRPGWGPARGRQFPAAHPITAEALAAARAAVLEAYCHGGGVLM